MLRGDPVRGDCCAGRRMDEALGIMGVFLLELYNPFIVYQSPKDKEGHRELPLGFLKPTEPLGYPKSLNVSTGSLTCTRNHSEKSTGCYNGATEDDSQT